MPYDGSLDSEQVPGRSDHEVHRTMADDYVARHPEPGTAVAVEQGMLPFSYLRSLYVMLLETGAVRFRGFDELPLPADADLHTEESLKAAYAQEFAAWRKAAAGAPPPARLDLFMLHDSDSGPHETEFLCCFESHLRVRSTTSVFVRERSMYGALRPYDIDYGLLRRLQDEHGQCFSYHSNAGEVALYHADAVPAIFNEDVDFLVGRGLNISCFSPHGGVPGPGGINNNTYFYPAFSRRRLYWTHNRLAPSGRRYSDGGLHPRLRRNDPALDMRTFFPTLLSGYKPGAALRCFMLLHAQYYFASDAALAEPHFAGNPWLEAFWEADAQGRTREFWEPARVALEAAFGAAGARVPAAG